LENGITDYTSNDIRAELHKRYKERQAAAKQSGNWEKLSLEWIVQALKSETVKKGKETEKSQTVLRKKMVADHESAVSVLQRGGLQSYHCSLVATWRVAPGVTRKDYKISVTQQPAADFFHHCGTSAPHHLIEALMYYMR
jgi:hypothetical protein